LTPGRRKRRLAALLALLLVGQGCQTGQTPPAGTRSPEERERAERNAIEAEGLSRLAFVFYQRLANRRVDSIATYQDPALREFFRTPEAFADYYAELVDQLNGASFEANRPLEAEVTDLVLTEPGRAVTRVRFVGENGRPLRWWRTSLDTEDQWERHDGRWWIIPGKL